MILMWQQPIKYLSAHDAYSFRSFLNKELMLGENKIQIEWQKEEILINKKVTHFTEWRSNILTEIKTQSL